MKVTISTQMPNKLILHHRKPKLKIKIFNKSKTNSPKKFKNSNKSKMLLHYLKNKSMINTINCSQNINNNVTRKSLNMSKTNLKALYLIYPCKVRSNNQMNPKLIKNRLRSQKIIKKRRFKRSLTKRKSYGFNK